MIMGHGVLGAAWATLLSYIVLLVVLIPHFFRNPDIQSMSRLLDETDAFLKARIANPSVAFAIEISTGELLKNIITYGYVKYGKRRYIDYRLSIMPDHVCVVISDDAKAFNPIGHRSKTGYGLQLLHALCKEMRYDYLFHQNIVKMEFDYGKTMDEKKRA